MPAFYHIKPGEKSVHKEIIEKINALKTPGKPYAAFDLDNTLLIGDIGEAVFALLVKKKLIMNFGWKDYLDLIEKDKVGAYKHIIDLMSGLNLNQLKEVTKEVMNRKTPISIEGYKLSVPKPNQQMKMILGMLKKKGIEIYVVTASNEVSAALICKKYFGIRESCIIGAEVARDAKGVIKAGFKEFPYGKGKVNILNKRFKNKPLVTGGDSSGDIYMLRHTIKEGIALWAGEESMAQYGIN
jgi:phosphoserine phosphatase